MSILTSSKAEIAAKILYGSGACKLLSLKSVQSYTESDRRLTVFAFHRLFRSCPVDGIDQSVFDMSADVFYELLKYLKSIGDVVSESELIDIVNRKSAMREHSFAITFDDGYVDNYNLAYPVLTALNIPAMFFVPCDLIEERSLGWWDDIAYMIRNSNKRRIEVLGQRFSLVGQHRKEASIDSIQSLMKTLPEEETKSLVDDLAVKTGQTLPQKIADSQLMTWEQICELDAAGHGIGSHTRSHRVLSTLSKEQQRMEIEASKVILERKLGKPVRTFAYPVGGLKHFNRTSKQLVESTGYQAAFSYGTGTNMIGSLDPFAIKRMSCAPTVSMNVAKAMLPRVFC